MHVLETLQKIGYSNLKDFGKEFRAAPLHRDSGNHTSLCINKLTGQWYDFSSREGGSLARLVRLTLNLPSIEAAIEYIGDESITSKVHDNIYELDEVKKFDKDLLPKLIKNHEYWINRNVSQQTIETFEGGVTYNGRMRHRYVFPIFNSREELVGFSGRKLHDDNDFPKWKHLGVKSNWCYPAKWNYHILQDLKEVILVESIGDMLSLWDAGIFNTLVTFGVDISSPIIELLLRLDAQKVLIAFNNDKEDTMVGNNAAQSGRKSLLRYFDKHQILTAIPESNDFGEMNKEQIKLWKTKFCQ